MSVYQNYRETTLRAFGTYSRLLWRVLAPGCGLVILVALSGTDATAATSVSAASITFKFDKNYQTGAYPDGMPWVVESSPGSGVIVTEMTPDFSSGRNGWEENPVTYELPTGASNCSSTKECDEMSMDSRLVGTNRHTYTSPLAKYGPLPRNMKAGTSVLKVRSSTLSGDCWNGTGGSDRTCIESAAVLTVLASPPPAGALRPPYMGTAKPHFTIAGLNIAAALPNLPLLTGSDQYTISEIRASFGSFPAPSNVHMGSEFDGRATPRNIKRPRSGEVASYGCDYGMQLASSMLVVSQAFSAAEKQDIVYQLLSSAIDHYYATKNGKNWGSGGCIHHGRKALIMWAGKLLSGVDQGSNQNAVAAMAAFNNGVDALDQMTYTSSVTGEALWGGSSCLSNPASDNGTQRACDQRRDGGGSKWGSGAEGSSSMQDTPSQQIAAGKFSYAAYQMMSDIYFGAASVARVYGFENEWNQARADNSDAFFKYVDRIAAAPWSRACSSHCDTYLGEMHKQYGCNSSQCASRRGSSAPPPVQRLSPPTWE